MFVYHSVCKMEAFSNPSFSSVDLVISPLKALMEDQLQEIAKYGISEVAREAYYNNNNNLLFTLKNYKYKYDYK